MKWRNFSRKKKIYVSLALSLIMVLLWAFISAGVITHGFNRSQLSVDGEKQEVLINGVIITETKEQTKYWELYGETGTYDSNNGVALMDNVIGNFYKDNEVYMSFQSSKGSYNADKKIINLYSDTFIALKDGTTLKADNLRYAGTEEPIIAKGNVHITRGNEFLATAEMVEIAPNYEHFKIIGKTKTKIFNGR